MYILYHTWSLVHDNNNNYYEINHWLICHEKLTIRPLSSFCQARLALYLGRWGRRGLSIWHFLTAYSQILVVCETTYTYLLSQHVHKFSHQVWTIWYSWTGHGLQSGPTLAFSLWLSDFKTKTSFGFLTKKSGCLFFTFFVKSKNELVRPKTMFLAILAKIWSFSNNSDM